jgi:hypothetical protein
VTKSLSPQGQHPTGCVPVLAVLAILIGAGLVVSDHVSERRARKELLAEISKASDVRMNGERVTDPRALLLALRPVDHVWAHHSHPTVPIRIELIDRGETTDLVVARDSQRQTEFWAYRPGANRLNDPLGQSAGRFTSAELDKFLRSRGL